MPLTKQQREELVKAYNDGLTKIDKSVSSKIEKLAENLHLSSSTIKNFILYHRSVERGVCRDRRKRVYQKGPTAYNAFCAEQGKGCRFGNWNVMWQALSAEEKDSYRQQALSRKAAVVVQNEQQRSRAIRSCLKIIGKQIENLNNLGTEVVCVAVDKERDAMFKTCTIIGDQWLERDNALQKFRDFVVHSIKTSTEGANNVDGGGIMVPKSLVVSTAKEELNHLRQEVQAMFNAKYSAAVGHSKSMPYKAVSEGRVVVHGLPPSCHPLVIPSHCSKSMLRALLAAANDITLEILPDTETVASSNNQLQLNVQQSTAGVDTDTLNVVMALLNALPSVGRAQAINQQTAGTKPAAMTTASTGTQKMQEGPADNVPKNTLVSRKRKAGAKAAPMTTASTGTQKTQAAPKTTASTGTQKTQVKVKKTAEIIFSGDDNTPCCVCGRRYNQPPVDEWVICIKCKQWHHVKCGPPITGKVSGMCFTCKP